MRREGEKPLWVLRDRARKWPQWGFPLMLGPEDSSWWRQNPMHCRMCSSLSGPPPPHPNCDNQISLQTWAAVPSTRLLC